MNQIRRLIRDTLINVIGKMKTSPENVHDERVYRILTYHRIKPGQENHFRRQLDRLQKNYNIVSPEEYEHNEGKIDKLNLLLTFDDGYEEWDELVVNEFNKRNITALFFVCPDFVGSDNEAAANYCETHMKVDPAPALSVDGLKNLIEEGHTIGNHLLKHRDLRNTSDRATIKSTFEQSQNAFRKRLDIQAKWLAYPFGDWFRAPDLVRNLASDFFEYAVTMIPGTNTSSTPRHFLHRDGFSPDFNPTVEKNWLRGGFDPLFLLTHLVKF